MITVEMAPQAIAILIAAAAFRGQLIASTITRSMFAASRSWKSSRASRSSFWIRAARRRESTVFDTFSPELIFSVVMTPQRASEKAFEFSESFTIAQPVAVIDTSRLSAYISS